MAAKETSQNESVSQPTGKRADYRLLAELRSFFKINYGTIVKPEPFRFLCLPAEVRNSIYEILLVFPGRTRWIWGYRHQADASVTADFPNEIPGRGLLSTNRQIRRESLSCLIGQNHFHLNALWLASFLESSTQVDLNGSLERVMIGSYLRRITLTITLTWQKHITREQSKGIKAYTWYWESDTLWADIKKLPNVRLEEHWDGDTLDQLGLSTALMLD
ncbi:Coiled-coil domain-containing protein mtmr15 [Lasiodiplodia theobromae]|uniref:Coiled-coil domain-containing protein mtmr15 n=1 Tax=Lasiodiplodia theobromae TaxID=45133 RepID=UPI0015C32409|nr:Coiled-coil domain-containing protein mtmr15 [Lasiodiplodia theobromae]KAF4534183.1 Coiled-coil domain-containing protein mtmr15 [Lasiodiplodia theobromae]